MFCASLLNVLYVQCRERGVTYSGRLDVRIGWKVNGVEQRVIERNIGHVPIMVKVSQYFNVICRKVSKVSCGLLHFAGGCEQQ
jgi:DNA-directed RNA polymerase beta subunit